MFRQKNIGWREVKIAALFIFLISFSLIFLLQGRFHEVSLSGECGSLDGLGYIERELCWYGQVKKEIKIGGVGRALGLTKRLYERYPDFAEGCHDVMHLVGNEAYKEYKKGEDFNFSEETTYCGYGFYHGFIEAMLYTTGDYSEVRNFCESANKNLEKDIESPNAIYSCYHGIGHSTFEAHDPRIWGDEVKMVDPGIKSCEEVTLGLEEEKTKQCVTGIFNALGIAYANEEYKLDMKEDDPVWVCRRYKTLYKKHCFIEVTIAWIYKEMGSFDYKFDDAALFIEKLNDIEGEKISMFGLSSDYTRLKKDNFDGDEMIENCRSIKKSLFKDCMEGTVWGLLGWGKPGEEYKGAVSFCNLDSLSSEERQDCFKYFLPILGTIYSTEEKESICNKQIPSLYKSYCNP